MASVLIVLTMMAMMAASCTTTVVEQRVLPIQPVIINRFFYLIPEEPVENCGGVPNCWYEEDGDLGEA